MPSVRASQCNLNLFYIGSIQKKLQPVIIPKHILTLRENGVYYASVKYFNQLPPEMREEHSYSRFIHKLKDLLLHNTVYNSNEF